MDLGLLADVETEATDRQRVRRRREAEIDVDAIAVLGRALRPRPQPVELGELAGLAAGEGDQNLDARGRLRRVNRHRVAKLDWLLRLVCKDGPT